MPVQRTLFGRAVTVPRRLPPRRILFTLGLIASFAVFSVVLIVSSWTAGSETATAVPPAKPSKWAGFNIAKSKFPKFTAPSIFNPFRPAAHAPPQTANSTNGEDSWFPDWKWLNPFSSSITLDENRAVLPPSAKRPFIYTFYDAREKKDDAVKKAESKLLLVWRRAWWVQGFRPVVLGQPEADKNPLAQRLHLLNITKEMEQDVVKWLAWGHMGTGIFANYRVLPMGSHEDRLLEHLRRGEFPSLTHYDAVGNGLFSGEKASIQEALKAVLSNATIKSTSVVSVISNGMVLTDHYDASLAFYNTTVIDKNYKVLSDKLKNSETEAEGLEQLALLINSHLHTVFQNTFSSGIAVLQPMPEHTTALIQPALQLATFLTQCPESPLPSSCPPNIHECNACISSQPREVSTPEFFRNTSSLYTIGTVPHPYTFISLTTRNDAINVPFIRRKTNRDTWISTLTQELLGTGIAGYARLVKFKDSVAGEWGRAHSLWVTAEKDMPNDLEWHFGFTIPKKLKPLPTANSPVPGTPPTLPKPASTLKPPTPAELHEEVILLGKARNIIQSKMPQTVKTAAEAWNLADREAWRFVRAYLARNQKERQLWEEEERKYGGAGADAGAR